MDGLYSLRSRPRGTLEIEGMKRPLFPNIQEQTSPEKEKATTLSDILAIAQKLKGQPPQFGQDEEDMGENVLLKRFATPSDTDIATRSQLQVPTSIEPEISPISPEPTPTNALLRTSAPVVEPTAQKSANKLLDYWGQPVVGKMPLDKFVQVAGMLGHAFAPETPMGRAGAGLSQIGGQAYAERIKGEREELERQRKEPENVLRMRLLKAQAESLEREKEPTEWVAFSKSLRGTIDPETGKIYSEGKILQKYHEAIRAPKEPKEPQYDIDVQQDPTTKEWMHGRRNKSTGVFTSDRPATPAEIEGKVTGKIKEPTAPALNYEYKNIGGVPHKRQVEWNAKTEKWVPKGDWIRTEKPEGVSDKLTMTDVKSAYSMDVGNIKNQMMIDMTPDEQMNLAGQPDVNILALLLAGRIGKSLSPEKKKYYTGKLQEIETYYGDLTNQVLGRKGAKIPTKTPVEMGGGLPKLPEGLPPGSTLIPQKSKRGNPVYKSPDGKLYEVSP